MRRLASLVIVVVALCECAETKEDLYKYKMGDDLQWARYKEVKKVFDALHLDKQLLPVINIIRSEGQVREVATDRKGVIGKLRGTKSHQETLSLSQAAGEIIGILYKQGSLHGRNLFSSYYAAYVTRPCKKITQRYRNVHHYVDNLLLFEQRESKDLLSMFKRYVDGCEILSTASMQAQVNRYFVNEMAIKQKTVKIQSLSPHVTASPPSSPSASPPSSPFSTPSSSSPTPPAAAPRQYPPQQYPQQYPQQGQPPQYQRPPPPDYRRQKQPPPPQQSFSSRGPYPPYPSNPPLARPQQSPPAPQYRDLAYASQLDQQYPRSPPPPRDYNERSPPPQPNTRSGSPPESYHRHVYARRPYDDEYQ